MEKSKGINMVNIETNIISAIQEMLAEKSISKKIDNRNLALVDELGFSSMDIALLIARFDMEFNKEPFAEDYAITDIRTIADLIAAYEGKGLG
jgi:acyl carrier protein